MSARRLVLVVPMLCLCAGPLVAGTVRQVTDVRTSVAGPAALDDAGLSAFVGSSADPAGTNPAHAFQILRYDAATGAVAVEASAPEGMTVAVSVSDDGRYLAFPSPANLTGGNHDESVELHVLDRATGTITQLTSDPAPNAGSVSLVAMAGNGSRVAFLANTDPLGTNPQHATQLFVIGRDGTGLLQLTGVPAGAGIGAAAISDDGTRLAFATSADLVGANPDLGGEIFAIEAAGAGLRQLTSCPAGFGAGAPALSGNGQKIAFHSDANLTGGNVANQTEVFALDWAGTGLRQLTTTGRVLGLLGDPASQTPAITDDGITVIVSSNHSRIFPPLNLDGNFELFRVRTDGTGGMVALTSTFLEYGALFPVVAGGGGRITYHGVSTAVSLEAMDGAGGSDVTLQTFDLAFQDQPDLSDDGARVVFVRSTGLLESAQIFRVSADGSDLAQVTSLAGSAAGPSLTGDGQRVVFSSAADPLGSNGDGSEEIFAIGIDGTGLVQLTSGPADTASAHPSVSTDGAVVVFDSDADPLGTNADLSVEIFAVRLDGTGLAQLTSGPAGTSSRRPRADGTGTWAVFVSNADLDGGNPDGTDEVHRVRIDGTALERLTGDPLAGAGGADVSQSGGRVAFSWAADPLGTNPEGNAEIFALEPATGTLRQLTAFATGSSGGARLTGDGAWVFFSSDAPVFETDPDRPGDLYRVPADGGPIERVGALRSGGLGAVGGIADAFGGGSAIAVGSTGDLFAFGGFGNVTGQNADLLSEIWVADFAALAGLEVGRASPTVLSWTPEPGPVRYDVIRGDLALVQGAGGVIDLGTVVCLEDDSPDADTTGSGDPVDPEPGQVFFFLYRGSQGLDAGTGSWGSASDGRERVAGPGGC